MLKITGVKFSNTGDDSYLILDTNDKVTQLITKRELLNGLKKGMIVGGACISTNGELMLQDTYIREAVGLFQKLVLPKIAMSKFLNKNDGIHNLAKQLGIIPTKGEELKVDFNRGTISLFYQRTTLSFDSQAVQEVERHNITDDNILELTKQGYLSFSSIDIKIGDIVCTLKDCLDELDLVLKGMNMERLHYIGITPSNMMFKISYYGSIYSVKFDSFDKAKGNVDKILAMKTTSYDFRYYLENKVKYSSTKRKIVVTKISYKRGLDIHDIKQKYKTLQDVYINI